MLEKREAIVLQSTPYQEQKKILNLLSQEGLFSLILTLSSKQPTLYSLSSPFCIGEFTFQKKGEICFLKEGTVLDENLALREDLSFLDSACILAKAILKSHFPSRPSCAYLLLSSYLKHIPFFKNQEPLIGSFLLKMLTAEGFLRLQESCNLCERNASYLRQGESLCPQHAGPYALAFSQGDFLTLIRLVKTKSFSVLKEISLSSYLLEKIRALFDQLI